MDSLGSEMLGQVVDVGGDPQQPPQDEREKGLFCNACTAQTRILFFFFSSNKTVLLLVGQWINFIWKWQWRDPLRLEAAWTSRTSDTMVALLWKHQMTMQSLMQTYDNNSTAISTTDVVISNMSHGPLCAHYKFPSVHQLKPTQTAHLYQEGAAAGWRRFNNSSAE